MYFALQFLVALLVTALCIRPLARLAPTLGLCDRPGPRKVHAQPMPRVGGIAMALGIVAATVLARQFDHSLTGLLAGAGTLLAFGIWDDRNDLGPLPKFAGQAIAVLLVMFLGEVRIDSVTLDMRHALPPAAGYLLTFVFLVGITNAVNLSDGLDGLAGGMVLLCLAAIALLAASNGQLAVVAMALAECGAILGFLRFNTHPAQVFMGDAGSQLLGFSTGVLAILATQGDQTPVSAALPLLLLGVPILDTLGVIVQRLRAGRSPFVSDRNHLHHRLLALGCAHSTAVALLYLLQVALCVLAWFMRYDSDAWIVGAFAVIAVVLFALAPRPSDGSRGTLWRRGDAGPGRLQQWRAAPPRGLLRSLWWLLAAVLASYAVASIAQAQRVGLDLAALCGAMLLLLAAFTLRPASAPLWMERIVLYVAVLALVYLDQTSAAPMLGWRALSWSLIGIAVLAALGRLALTDAPRFHLTTLDVLVLFAALVVPNLPGNLNVAPEVSAGIAKTVVLLYVAELQLGTDVSRAPSHAFLAFTFCAIAARGFVSGA